MQLVILDTWIFSQIQKSHYGMTKMIKLCRIMVFSCKNTSFLFRFKNENMFSEFCLTLKRRIYCSALVLLCKKVSVFLWNPMYGNIAFIVNQRAHLVVHIVYSLQHLVYPALFCAFMFLFTLFYSPFCCCFHLPRQCSCVHSALTFPAVSGRG